MPLCYNVYDLIHNNQGVWCFMEEQIGVKDEITLSELFRILCRKALVLILAFAIGLIAGGVFGVLKTWNVQYYGATVEFYVNPSQSENTDVETNSQYGIYGAYGKPMMDSILELLESESFSETLMLDENGMPDENGMVLEGLPEEVKQYIEAGEADKALDTWRTSKHYQKTISLVSSAISFTGITDTNANETLAKSFIIVKISVLNGEDQAKILIDRVKTHVPTYVAQNMAKPAGYDKTNCQRITRLDDVELLNPGELQSTAIKYAILLGGATLLAACVAVIAVDYSDKRLRNFERTMEQLGVPVLGVIPTINEPAPKSQTNKEVA